MLGFTSADAKFDILLAHSLSVIVICDFANYLTVFIDFVKPSKFK